jgi:hypothetical protein
MALSQVQIINMALAKVGDMYISSLTEGTKQAIFANIFWENARDSLLEAHPWNFAMERVRLALLAGAPVWGYNHKYQLPNDCLKVLDVSTSGDFDSTQTIDYKIEGRTLVTSEDTVYIKYTKQVTDTSYYPPSFSRALACQLAVMLAEPLAKPDAGEKQLLLQECEIALQTAKARDFDEGHNEEVGLYQTTFVRDN